MLWLLIAALAVAADQLTKYAATVFLKPVYDLPLIDGVLHLTYVTNSGASWGILSGRRTFFIVITVIAVCAAVCMLYFSKLKKSRLFCWSMALIIGGAVGNLIDRVRLGYVVDMISLRFIDFPVFNAADMVLTAGAICLICYALFYKEDKHE